MELSGGHKKIILYANPGTEGFYGALGFLRMNTAMAIWHDPARGIESGLLTGALRNRRARQGRRPPQLVSGLNERAGQAAVGVGRTALTGACRLVVRLGQAAPPRHDWSLLAAVRAPSTGTSAPVQYGLQARLTGLPASARLMF